MGLPRPSPALMAQAAAHRLPRLAIYLLALAYVLPGFLGRMPWKNADIAAFGVMRELALIHTNWLHPQLLGLGTTVDALLPYWLGAIAIKLLPFLDPALAVRLPFMALLLISLTATWHAVYCLARSPRAQPVAFAFGGQASPKTYAGSLADAGLLALLACLGLAQLSHETTPVLAQLCCITLVFYAIAAGPYHSLRSHTGPALGAGLLGLALSGAPAIATALGLISIVLEWSHTRWSSKKDPVQRLASWQRVWCSITITIALLVVVSALQLWRWRIIWPDTAQFGSLTRLLLWFTWPAWPMALWTLWRWHRQLSSRHIAIPLALAALALSTALCTPAADRSLLMALPPLAALAAFALPTLKRSVASLIDWFTLLFFSSCALIIWIVWIAMQTGFPRQPAANVAKLAPGFETSFSWLTLLIALAASLAWAWLVKWRVSKQRSIIWKSLVLPAGGATLCWLLLMTLWLPLLDYARSYAPLAKQVAALINKKACIQVYGLSHAQITALQYHGRLQLRPASPEASCPTLIVDADSESSMANAVNPNVWVYQVSVRRPTDKNEDVLIFQRKDQATSPLEKRRARGN